MKQSTIRLQDIQVALYQGYITLSEALEILTRDINKQ